MMITTQLEISVIWAPLTGFWSQNSSLKTIPHRNPESHPKVRLSLATILYFINRYGSLLYWIVFATQAYPPIANLVVCVSPYPNPALD